MIGLQNQNDDANHAEHYREDRQPSRERRIFRIAVQNRQIDEGVSLRMPTQRLDRLALVAFDHVRQGSQRRRKCWRY